MKKKVAELVEELQSERKNVRIQNEVAVNLDDLLKKVESLNALSDSNRMLRHERDSIKGALDGRETKIKSLMERIEELLKERETLTQENESLRNEATRWRLRANSLIEKPSKATSEDLKRVQVEKDNVSSMLNVERQANAKRLEEWKVESQ